MYSDSKGTSPLAGENLLTRHWEICSETAPPAGPSGYDTHPFLGDPGILEFCLYTKMDMLSLTLPASINYLVLSGSSFIDYETELQND